MRETVQRQFIHAKATGRPGTTGTPPSTVKGNGAAPRNQSTEQVAPPSAIQSSTDVMQSEATVRGKDQGGRTDTIKYLPEDMR